MDQLAFERAVTPAADMEGWLTLDTSTEADYTALTMR
jgi:hypothetical protein